MRFISRTTWVAFAWMVLIHQQAHAYLDPGTGSMLLQVILGGIAGLLVAGKLFWNRILTFLRIRKPKDPDPTTPDEEQDLASTDK